MSSPPCFIVDPVTRSVRIEAIDTALFMRLSDLLLICSEAGEVPPDDFLQLVDSRVSKILLQLHGQRRIHGDVSPENIVVTHFGGCSLLHPPIEGGQVEATPFNTPFSDTLGPNHDMFALGCVLFTIANNGQPPYVGSSPAALREAMSAGIPPLPRRTSEELRLLVTARLSFGFTDIPLSVTTPSTPVLRVTPLLAPVAATASHLDISLEEVTAALDLGGGSARVATVVAQATVSRGGGLAVTKQTATTTTRSRNSSSEAPALSRSQSTSGGGAAGTVRRTASTSAMVARGSHPEAATQAQPLPRTRNYAEGDGLGEVRHTVPPPPQQPQVESVRSRSVLEESYISPLMARKLAAVAAEDAAASTKRGASTASTGAAVSGATAPPEMSQYEKDLAEARAEAFRARLALLAKHADFAHPAAPSTATAGARNPRKSLMADGGGEGSAAAGEGVGERSASLERTSASTRAGIVASRKSALPRTPPDDGGVGFASTPPRHAPAQVPAAVAVVGHPGGYGYSSPGVGGGGDVSASNGLFAPPPAFASSPPRTPVQPPPSSPVGMATPLQLRAARLAAEQKAYEDSLTAARRQAFEDRLQLQSRYGRGGGT